MYMDKVQDLLKKIKLLPSKLPNPNTVSDLYKKLSNKAGLRYNRLHDARHTHATELLRAGEPLHVVAHRLGHRDAMVTATIYAHVDTEQSVSASETFAKAMRAN